MARKKKDATPKKKTYFKAKNGRFYKKVVIDGRTRCRFVSNAEAMGTVAKKTGRKSSSPPKPQEKSGDASRND